MGNEVNTNFKLPNWLTIQPQQGVNGVAPYSPVDGASYQGGLAEVSSDLNLGKCCGTSSTGTYGTDTRVGALEAALSKFGFTDDSGRVYG